MQLMVLGFEELNPLAIGFPLWIFVLKFGVCFVPMVCAYVMDKFEMEKYLLLPFMCSAILIEVYVFVVASACAIFLEYSTRLVGLSMHNDFTGRIQPNAQR